MPMQISAHLSATLYGVAEKAADLIKASHWSLIRSIFWTVHSYHVHTLFVRACLDDDISKLGSCCSPCSPSFVLYRYPFHCPYQYYILGPLLLRYFNIWYLWLVLEKARFAGSLLLWWRLSKYSPRSPYMISLREVNVNKLVMVANLTGCTGLLFISRKIFVWSYFSDLPSGHCYRWLMSLGRAIRSSMLHKPPSRYIF